MNFNDVMGLMFYPLILTIIGIFFLILELLFSPDLVFVSYVIFAFAFIVFIIDAYLYIERDLDDDRMKMGETDYGRYS